MSLPPCLHILSLTMIATFGLLFPVSSRASFRDCGCGGTTCFFGLKGFYSSRLAARTAHTQRVGRRKSSGPSWLGFRFGPNMSPLGSNLGVSNWLQLGQLEPKLGSNLGMACETWLSAGGLVPKLGPRQALCEQHVARTLINTTKKWKSR